MVRVLRSAAMALALVACDPGDEPQPVFPATWAQSYEVLWPCRPSVEHELHNVIILADPPTAAAYRAGAPLPAGGVVLKQEFGEGGCERVVGFTAMKKDDATQMTPGGLGWRWQKVDVARKVIQDGAPATCVSCHKGCDVLDRTCARPL